MPTPTVKSFAKKSGKSVSEVEKLWNDIKDGAKKKYKGDRLYSYVTGTLKKILKINESKFDSLFESIMTEMELENKTVDREQFKNWFGESKVKYDNGEPMIVFHGTNNDTFSEVDNEEDVETVYPNKLGFWFADTRSAAGKQGDNVMSVYVKMEHPKLITQKKWDIIREKYSNSENYWKSLRKKLMDKGYDGIFIPKITYDGGEFSVKDSKVMAVFTSNQMKSAISNSGDFDIDNKDIYK